MSKTYRRYYILMLAFLLALFGHPLVNGVHILLINARQGYIEEAQYARYVVPYAALGFALVVCCALQPLLLKAGRWALPIAMLLALGLFFAVEPAMESIQVRTAMPDIWIRSTYPTTDLWQWASCAISPTAIASLEEQYVSASGLYVVGAGEGYKLHYYLICSVLALMFTGALTSLGRAYRGDTPRRALWLRLICALVLAALCAMANATGFFRTTDPIQAPLAGGLTMLFFVMLGACFGAFAGSFARGKAARWVAAGAGALVTCAMYAGEHLLLGGALYRFGTGWAFEALPLIALSLVDLIVVALGGLIPWLVTGSGRTRNARPYKESAPIETNP